MAATTTKTRGKRKPPAKRAAARAKLSKSPPKKPAKTGRPKKTWQEAVADGTFTENRYGAERRADIEKTLPVWEPRNRKIKKPRMSAARRREQAIDCYVKIAKRFGCNLSTGCYSVENGGKPSKKYTVEQLDELGWNHSDDLAIKNGCWFCMDWAEHFEKTVTENFKLWEGDWGNQPFAFLRWQHNLLILFGWARWHDERKRSVRRFSKAAVWVAKKNGKSPTGAAVGWYLFMFDGEHGQKVFTAAKDGGQAGIVQGHAVNMRQVSPALRHRTRLNKNTKGLSFPKTLSTWDILASGGGVNTIESKEGLNGSLILDEAHVVDAGFMRVVTDMGASRPDALRFQISTYGQNLDSYGRDDYEYGLDVVKGEHDDDSFFFLNFGLPDDFPESEMDDPAIWAVGNPSLGETVSSLQFESAHKRARRKGGADWAAHKQRRLNQWQDAAVEGIGREWMKWADPLDITDLFGMGGGVGLDASDSDDATVAVFAIPLDGFVYLHPMIWMTERSIDKYSDLADLRDWAKAGHINMVPGSAIRGQTTWEPAVDMMMQEIGTSAIVHDKTYAAGWGMRWQDEWGEDRPVIQAPQGAEYYSAPMKDFEDMVHEGEIRHPGNPALDWMMRNYLVKQFGSLRRPIKDPKKPGKKIDGVQATIMSLDALRLAENVQECCYNDDDYEIPLA